MIDPQDKIINRLKFVGLNGVRRVWSMGDTVIAFRKYNDVGDGIKSFDGYVCIFQNGDHWEHHVGMILGEKFVTADLAVERAIEILKMGQDELDTLMKKRILELRNQANQSLTTSP